MAWQHLGRASAPLAPIVGSFCATQPRLHHHGSDPEVSHLGNTPRTFRDNMLLLPPFSLNLFKSGFAHNPSRAVPARYSQCSNVPIQQLVLPLKREDIIKARQKGSFSDEYETGKMLGEGSFGTVSLCKHRRSNDEFAVKVIAKRSINEYDDFINEVKLLMELDHPHIIKLIEYFEEDNEVKLIFDLCTGMDMFDKTVQFIDEKGHFSALETACALRQMIKAVIGCHSHRIIHKDIKPENFMIKDAKKEEKTGFTHASIRLIDLGISERFGDGEERKTCTSSSTAYAAPEVFHGSYDEKCDVWSLGVIMYLMIVGEPLFPLTEPDEVVKSLIENKKFIPKALKQITKATHPWITDEAKDLMRKMLDHDSSRRISLKDALNHAFIQGGMDKDYHRVRSMAGTAYDSEVSKKLEFFAQMPALKRAALLIMSHIAPESSTVLQRRTFRSMDVDFDGQLSKEELEDWFKANQSEGLELPATWNTVFEQIDVDQSGFVQYCEFLAGTLPPSIYLQEHSIAQAFTLFDVSHDGKVDEEDLLTLVQNRVPRKVIQRIIAEASPHGKLYLTYDDFKEMMSRDEHCTFVKRRESARRSDQKSSLVNTINSFPVLITLASCTLALISLEKFRFQ